MVSVRSLVHRLTIRLHSGGLGALAQRVEDARATPRTTEPTAVLSEV